MAAETAAGTRSPAPLRKPQSRSQSILDRIAEEGRIGQSPEERTSGKLWLKDLVQEVMTGQMTVSNDTEAMINSRIARTRRADLQATERGDARRAVPETGRLLARAALFRPADRNIEQPEDQADEHQQERIC